MTHLLSTADNYSMLLQLLVLAMLDSKKNPTESGLMLVLEEDDRPISWKISSTEKKMHRFCPGFVQRCTKPERATAGTLSGIGEVQTRKQCQMMQRTPSPPSKTPASQSA
jgi:hypothetical protein